MAFSGTITGVLGTNRALGQAEGRVLDGLYLGVQRGVLGGQSIVRGNARGRPGPRAVTGDFNRSIVANAERSGSQIFGQIGTNAAQGRRLEYGFVGPDRLGRVYNQPPYPYLQPSIPKVRAMIGTEVQSAIGKALS